MNLILIRKNCSGRPGRLKMFVPVLKWGVFFYFSFFCRPDPIVTIRFFLSTFRDVRHVFMLVHRLLDGLPQHTRLSVDAGVDAGEDPVQAQVEDEESLQRALVRALDLELRAVAATWAARSSREALHPLEISTDLAAQRLRIKIV